MQFDRVAAQTRAEKFIARIDAQRKTAQENGDDPSAIAAEPYKIAKDLLFLLISTSETSPPPADLVAERDTLRKRLTSLGAVLAGAADLLAEHMPADVASMPPSLTLVFNGCGDLNPDKIEQAVRRAFEPDEDPEESDPHSRRTQPPPEPEQAQEAHEPASEPGHPADEQDDFFGPGSGPREASPAKSDPPTDPADPRQVVVPGSVDTSAAPAASSAARPAEQKSGLGEERETPIESWQPSEDFLESFEGVNRSWLDETIREFKHKNAGQKAKRWTTSCRAYVRGKQAQQSKAAGK